MRVAIIHDWLDKRGGAENVLEQILLIYPKADIFTLVDFAERKKFPFLSNKKITVSFVQKLPFARKCFRNYLALFPYAIRGFNLEQYDLIISSSHAVAKGIRDLGKPHLCYIHSPIRYAWDMQDSYLQDAGLNKGIKGWLAKTILAYIRKWDYKNAQNIKHFYANSSFIKARVKRCYGKEAGILYPSADTEFFSDNIANKQDYYFTTARHVSYKRIDLVVKAFNQMPDRKLIIAGSGDETERLKKLSANNIEFTGNVDRAQIKKYMQSSKAFIYAALEDFGIVMVESLAAGTPVIAYGKGGACDIVTEKTGILFQKQNTQHIINAVNDFEKRECEFLAKECAKRAEKFSHKNFRTEFKKIVEQCLKENQ